MADRGGHRHRISKDQRESIILAFMTTGLEAAQNVATGFGLAPTYAIRLIRARGLL